MPKLIPVDYDPFAQEKRQEGPRLVPVDHDPFADAPQASRAGDSGLPDLQPGEALDLMTGQKGKASSGMELEDIGTEKEQPGLLSRLGTMGKAAGLGLYGAAVDVLPKTMAETYRSGDVPLNDASLAGRVIEENKADMARRQLTTDEAQTSVLGLTAQDVKSGIENLGYSGASILAGMGAGAAAGSVVPGPGTVAGAVVGAGAAGAAVGYRATKDQFIQDILERAKAQDPNLNEAKWQEIRSAVEDDAQLYGFWEAAPEAVGNMLTAGIIKAPVGKLFSRVPVIKNGIAKALASAGVKVAGALAEELPTETVTQHEQGAIEARQGLRDEAPTWGQAFEEVAPQVGVTTVATLGLGAAANRIGRKSAKPAGEVPAAPQEEALPLTDIREVGGERYGLEPPKDQRVQGEARLVPLPDGVEPPFDIDAESKKMRREEALARNLDKTPLSQDEQARDDEAGTRAAQELARAIYLEGQGNQEEQQSPDPIGLEVNIDQAEAARLRHLEQPGQPAQELRGIEPPAPGFGPASRNLPVPSRAIPQPAAPGGEFPGTPDAFLAQEPSVIPGGPGYTPNLPVPAPRREAMAPEAPYTSENLAKKGKGDLLALAKSLDMDVNFLKKLGRSGISANILRRQEETVAAATKGQLSPASAPEPTPLDQAAHQAATSPQNDLPEPTQAQKEAGNYQKGHVDFQGLDISVENPAGSVRTGKSPEGKEWRTTMAHHYGYIKGTLGKDKDHIDAFIGPKQDSGRVFIVDQVDPKTQKFDEHKVMLGFDTPADARAGYLANYEKGWKGLGTLTEMAMPKFKAWLAEGRRSKPAAGDIDLTPKADPQENLLRQMKNELERGVQAQGRPHTAAERQKLERDIQDLGTEIAGGPKLYSGVTAQAALARLPKAELNAKAKEMGIEKPGPIKKQDLISLIQEKERERLSGEKPQEPVSAPAEDNEARGVEKEAQEPSQGQRSIILGKGNAPYPTRKAAEVRASAQGKRTGQPHEAVEVNGGWGVYAIPKGESVQAQGVPAGVTVENHPVYGWLVRLPGKETLQGRTREEAISEAERRYAPLPAPKEKRTPPPLPFTEAEMPRLSPEGAPDVVPSMEDTQPIYRAWLKATDGKQPQYEFFGWTGQQHRDFQKETGIEKPNGMNRAEHDRYMVQFVEWLGKKFPVGGEDRALTSPAPRTTVQEGAQANAAQDTGRERRLRGQAGSDRLERPGERGQDVRGTGPDAGGADLAAFGREPSRTALGSAVEVIHSEGQDQARYEVREAADLVPSHDPTASFAKRQDYPPGVQERPYHSEPGEQLKVKTNAARLNPALLVTDNPDATNGPPLVTERGVVLGGNSRAMSLQLAYERGGDKADVYRQALKDKAAAYGLNPADVEGFTAPVLVRVVAAPAEAKSLARKVRLYNQPLTQGLSAKAEGVSKARLISDDTMGVVAAGLAKHDTLRQYLDSPDSMQLVDALVGDGALEQSQLSRVTNSVNGLLNPDGKNMVERMLRGRVITDLDLLDAAPPSMLQKVDRALPAMIQAQRRGEGWDITPLVPRALRQIVKAAGMEDLGTYFKQAQLLADADRSDADVQIMAYALDQMGPKQYQSAWEYFSRQAQATSKGQAVMPMVTPKAPEQAYQEAFVDRRGSEGQKQGGLMGKGRASIAQADGDRIPMADLQEVADTLSRMAANAGPTLAVQSVADMPTGAQREYRRILAESGGDRRLRALFYEGSTYLIADNTTSAADALNGWMHDQAGHGGVRKLFPSDRQFRNALDLVYRSIPLAERRKIAKLYGITGTDLDSRLKLADEHLGRLAEKVTLDETLGPKERPAWRRFLDAIRDLWDRIWRKITGRPLSEKDIAAIVRDAARLVIRGKASGEARAIYEKATGEPVMGVVADMGRSDARASMGRSPMPGEFGEQLDRLFSEGLPRADVLHLGQTPDVLRKLGAEDLPLAMTQATARKISEKHGISVEMMKRLPEQIASPVAVFDSATQGGGLVVLTELRAGDNPVIAAVHLEKVRNEMLVNDVASAYGKDGFGGWLEAQHQAGRWRYVDKKKLPALLRRAGLQLPGKPFNAGSKNPILTDADIVKGSGEGTGRASMVPGNSPEQSRDEQGRFSRVENETTRAQEMAEESRSDAKPSLFRAARELRQQKLLEPRDLRRMEKMFRQPYWLAKEHPEFKALLDAEIKRENNRSEAVMRSWQGVAEAVNSLDSAGKEQLNRAIWAIEGKKLKNVTEHPFQSGGKNNKGRALLELNEAHYSQLQAELERMKATPEVARAVVAIRRSLDTDLMTVYNRLANMREVEDGDIDSYRKQIGQIPNYFPHVRYGDHFIKAADPKTGDTLYREHFYAPPWFSSVQAARYMHKVQERFPRAKWEWGKVKGLPEEVWEYPIPVDATEQVIKAAVDKLKGDSQEKDALKKAMHEATADVFKERGWGRHMIRRQDIPGFETENVLRILWDHKNGLHGWLTKMDAARDMTGLLWSIDAKAKPQLYSYSAQYVRDMLRNSDSTDRMVGMLKAAMFIKFLGGNLKTAALNLTQNLVAGIPRLSAEGATAAGVKYFKAAMDSAVNMLGGKGGIDAEERAFLEDLYFKGVTQDQFMREATGRVKGAFAGVLSTLAQGLALPMSLAEKFNRVSLGLAAYRMARDGAVKNSATLKNYGYKAGEKFNTDDSAKFAETIVLDSHFLYGKGNKPEVFRGSQANRLLSSAYTFRTFSHGLLSLWRHLLTSPDMGWRGKRAFAASMLATWTLGGLAATPLYGLASSLIRQLVGDDPEEELRKMLPGPMAGDAVLYGLPSMVGVSFTGSMGMELPIFDRLELDKPVMEQVLGQAYEIVGVPVATLQMLGRGTEAGWKGDWRRMMEEFLPTAFANPIQAYRLYTEGAYTRSGRPIALPGSNEPQRLTGAEAVGKAFGFQPVSRTKAYEMQRSMDERDNYRMRTQDRLVRAFLQAKRDNDTAAKSEVLAEWREWNREQREAGRPEFLIEPLPKLARERDKAKRPPKRFRREAKEMRELYGM
jgi:hypothetical protein